MGKKAVFFPSWRKTTAKPPRSKHSLTLITTATQIYNGLLLNRIWLEVGKVLKKNQYCLQRNRSTIYQSLNIRRIIEWVRAKNFELTLSFVDFFTVFDAIHRGKMVQILLAYHHHHHHHHVVPLARISLTLSRHFSLSFTASGRSSGLHPVSSHSCCMYVRAGRPAFARPYAGVHRSTSLMSSSLASPAVSCMSGSSNLDSFHDGRQVAV